jgi:CubicO group peptidase (beta-lactamase class C family)
LEFEPGTAYSYSNTNTLLVGKVVESITGRSVTEELDERMRSHGMTDLQRIRHSGIMTSPPP